KRTASVSTRQSSARPVSITSSTARRLMAGSVPGRPRQIGQVREFGSSVPSEGGLVGHGQNIFESVRSCACTSMPMTVSYWVAGGAVIGRLYRDPRGMLRRDEDRRMGQ